MIVTAPAKINLTLSIVGKRQDGFHALESVMQILSLADVITISEADEIEFACSVPELDCEDNLVVRAARLMQSRCPIPRGAHIHLEKRIPAQAGLGGGSSDAATTIMALNEFWEVRLTSSELVGLAAQLGSDVPFFLNGPSAVVQGRGEIVNPVIHPTEAYFVLAKPSAGLSTAKVFSKVHAATLPADYRAEKYRSETLAMIHALQSSRVDAVAKALMNDLEGPALSLMPELIPLRERMLESGCLSVLLCGSGSALCGICPDANTARHAAIDLTNDFPWTWAGPNLLFR